MFSLSSRVRFVLLPLLAGLLFALNTLPAHAAPLSSTIVVGLPDHLAQGVAVDQHTLAARLHSQVNAIQAMADPDGCAAQPTAHAIPNNTPLPDLAISETDDGPANFGTADGLEVMHWQATVINSGTAATTHTTRFILLHIGDASKNPYTVYTVPVLKPGETKTFTGSLTFRQGGMVMVWFGVSPSCYYQELDDSNNYLFRDFSVLTKGFDLAAADFSYHHSPNNAGEGITAGETFSLFVEIANTGDVPATKPVQVALTLPLGGKTTLTIPAQNLPQPGQTLQYDLVDATNQPVQYTAPNVTHPTYYTKGSMKLNPTHSAAETSYSDNTTKAYIYVVPLGVNLNSYMSLHYPTCFPLVGESDGSITITVENSGAQTSNVTQGRLVIDGKMPQTFTIPSISGGSHTAITLSLPPMTKAGKHTFTVTVDSSNTIPEYNEKDNSDYITQTFYATSPI